LTLCHVFQEYWHRDSFILLVRILAHVDFVSSLTFCVSHGPGTPSTHEKHASFEESPGFQSPRTPSSSSSHGSPRNYLSPSRSSFKSSATTASPQNWKLCSSITSQASNSSGYLEDLPEQFPDIINFAAEFLDISSPPLPDFEHASSSPCPTSAALMQGYLDDDYEEIRTVQPCLGQDNAGHYVVSPSLSSLSSPTIYTTAVYPVASELQLSPTQRFPSQSAAQHTPYLSQDAGGSWPCQSRSISSLSVASPGIFVPCPAASELHCYPPVVQPHLVAAGAPGPLQEETIPVRCGHILPPREDHRGGLRPGPALEDNSNNAVTVTCAADCGSLSEAGTAQPVTGLESAFETVTMQRRRISMTKSSIFNLSFKQLMMSREYASGHRD
jgi:hypothetical protein